MEYVDGATLDQIFRDHIRKGTWLGQDEALDYLKQILQGLSFAHSGGVYHRDVKPTNILVSKLGAVKLVDFGLAETMLTESEPGSRVTGLPWTGTPNFMSIEQATGEPLDHQTDIFSAGLVGHILLTGRHPFNHPSGIASVFDFIKDPSIECRGEMTDLSGKPLPDEFRVVLTRMIKKTKTERYQSLLEPLGELSKESPQTCSRCGSPNPKTDRFCGQCGSSLAGTPLPAEITAAGILKIDRELQSPERLTDEGFSLARQNLWPLAIEKYKQAIEIDAKYARAYANLGFASNRFGQFEEGIEYLNKAISLANNDDALLHRAYDNRGFARSNMKDYEGAIADFTKAIEYNSNNPRVYYHRAESRAQAGDYEAAYGDVQMALWLDSDFESAIRLRDRLQDQARTKGFTFIK
jgi:serine/threonine protein kinase